MRGLIGTRVRCGNSSELRVIHLRGGVLGRASKSLLVADSRVGGDGCAAVALALGSISFGGGAAGSTAGPGFEPGPSMLPVGRLAGRSDQGW